MRRPSVQAVLFSIFKSLLIAIITQLCLAGLYYLFLKSKPYGLDGWVIQQASFVTGFAYYFLVEQKKLFPRNGNDKEKKK
jgi:ABC-type uncharacterized transport system permease subunit